MNGRNIKISAKKTLKFLLEQGVRVPLTLLIKNTIEYFEGDNRLYKTYIFYSEVNGVKIRKAKNNFLCYFNARITEDYVVFLFSERELMIEEVSGESETKNLVQIDKIMEKINKLLSVSEQNGASENEALIASMKAQELMKKYNIDYLEMIGERKEDIEEVMADTKKGNVWKRNLAVCVATSYCCKVYFQENTFVFRGYRSDIMIARRIYIYLLETCIKLGHKYEREKKMKGDRSLYISFCLGFCNGVNQKLGENCKALALIVPPEVEKDFEEFTANFKVAKNRSYKVNQKAYEKGTVEGKIAVNGTYISQNGSV